MIPNTPYIISYPPESWFSLAKKELDSHYFYAACQFFQNAIHCSAATHNAFYPLAHDQLEFLVRLQTDYLEDPDRSYYQIIKKFYATMKSVYSSLEWDPYLIRLEAIRGIVLAHKYSSEGNYLEALREYQNVLSEELPTDLKEEILSNIQNLPSTLDISPAETSGPDENSTDSFLSSSRQDENTPIGLSKEEWPELPSSHSTDNTNAPVKTTPLPKNKHHNLEEIFYYWETLNKTTSSAKTTTPHSEKESKAAVPRTKTNSSTTHKPNDYYSMFPKIPSSKPSQKTSANRIKGDHKPTHNDGTLFTAETSSFVAPIPELSSKYYEKKLQKSITALLRKHKAKAADEAKQRLAEKLTLLQQAGLTYAKEEKYTEAIAAYREALTYSSENKAIRDDLQQLYKQILLRGNEARDTQQSEKALRWYDLLIVENPDQDTVIQAYRYKAVIYAEQLKESQRTSENFNKDIFDLAVDVLKKAIELNPNLPELHFELGNLHQIAEQYSEAIKKYQESRSIINQFPNPALSTLYEEINSALKTCESKIIIPTEKTTSEENEYSGTFDDCMQKAAEYEKAENFEKAKIWYLKALEMRPAPLVRLLSCGGLDPDLKLIDIDYKLDEYQLSIERANRVIPEIEGSGMKNIMPFSELLARLHHMTGLCHLFAGQDSLAKPHLKAAKKHEIFHLSSLIGLGKIEENKGNVDNTKRLYAEVWEKLQQALASNNLVEAETIYDAYIAVGAGEKYVAWSYKGLAQLAEKAKDFLKASEFYLECINSKAYAETISDEEKAEIHFLCAMAFMKNKQVEKAHTHLETAVTLNPNNENAHKFLASIKAKLSSNPAPDTEKNPTSTCNNAASLESLLSNAGEADESTFGYGDWIARALEHEASEFFEEAKRCYLKALEMRPTWLGHIDYSESDPAIKIIDTCYHLGEYQTVIESATKLLEELKKSGLQGTFYSDTISLLHSKIGFCYFHLKQDEHAKAYLRKVKPSQKFYTSSIIGLGKIAEKKGDLPTADSFYAEAWDTAEKAFKSNYLIEANFLYSLFIDVEAKAYVAESYLRLIRIAESHKDFKSGIKNYLNYFERSVYSKVIPDLEKAKIHFSLGMAYMKNKELALARSHLEISLKFRPDYEDAKKFLTSLQQKLPKGSAAQLTQIRAQENLHAKKESKEQTKEEKASDKLNEKPVILNKI